MVQLVEHLTLDFSSGHDPRVMESSPASASTLNAEPASDILPPSLSLSPPLPTCVHTSLKINLKKTLKKNIQVETSCQGCYGGGYFNWKAGLFHMNSNIPGVSKC